MLHFLLVVIVSMESQFRSYELKAYSSGLAHQSSSSSYCDSLLQKRTYQTFTEDDFFEEVEEEKESCEPLEKESSIGSGSPQSNDDGIKGKFVLSNEKFPTFQLAFQWCQRNRYKYERHSKTYADQVLEADKYKTYFYVILIISL